MTKLSLLHNASVTTTAVFSASIPNVTADYSASQPSSKYGSVLQPTRPLASIETSDSDASSAAEAMQKLHVPRRRNDPKQFWQLPAITRRQQRIGCCARLHLYEENARFVLLAVLMLVYLCIGAMAFHFIESPGEQLDKQNFTSTLSKFLSKHRRVNETALMELLWRYGNYSLKGHTSERPRWDWSGSFYFVGTIVSTIGFGMTTPQTATGKALVICYGFIGCAGAILFFNLFLERIVTLLAYILRFLELIKERWRASKTPKIKVECVSETTSETDSLEQWKPSVHGVMIILLLLATILVCTASAVFSSVENWTYAEAVYFCFVTFSTIGFGDYISSQQANDTRGIVWYRMANFVFLTLGCCCIYSLFNVTSIIIRQTLNRMIKLMDCRCSCQPPRQLFRRNRRHLGLGLSVSSEADAASEDESSRRNSDGVISLKEFLEHNKMSLVMIQKGLIEHAQRLGVERNYDTSLAISATAVGPLAILTKKFGED